MKKYYLIPITEKCIYFKKTRLRDILKENYYDLYRKEIERIEILYSTDPNIDMPKEEKERYEAHLIKTKKLYEDMKIPQKLIAYGDNDCVKEIVTKKKLKSEYDAALGIREASESEVLKYCLESDYYDKVINYFEGFSNTNKKGIKKLLKLANKK